MAGLINITDAILSGFTVYRNNVWGVVPKEIWYMVRTYIQRVVQNNVI